MGAHFRNILFAMTDKRPTLSLKPKAPKAKPASDRRGAGAAGRKPAQAAERGQSRAQGQGQGSQAQGERAPAQPASASGYQLKHHVVRAPREEPRLRASHEVKVAPQRDYKPDLKSDSLALALLGAASAVARVQGGMALPQALSIVFGAYDVTPQTRGATS
jgi:16S rRNA (cytosine967-C5)-methyltransferase